MGSAIMVATHFRAADLYSGLEGCDRGFGGAVYSGGVAGSALGAVERGPAVKAGVGDAVGLGVKGIDGLAGAACGALGRVLGAFVVFVVADGFVIAAALAVLLVFVVFTGLVAAADLLALGGLSGAAPAAVVAVVETFLLFVVVLAFVLVADSLETRGVASLRISLVACAFFGLVVETRRTVR